MVSPTPQSSTPRVSPSTTSADRQTMSRRDLMAVATAAGFAVAPILVGAHPAAARAAAQAAAQATPDASPAATPAASPVAGGRLRFAVQGDPSELDPALTNLAAAGLVIDLMYEGLTHEG
ncbi:MAG: hypothetical protein ACTHMX_14185, partial [Thermomicrobiales bacterium]